MMKKTFWILVLALAASLFSSTVPSETAARYADIMGCEQSCMVAAGGWPFAYVIDYPGLSVAGRADAFGLALGEDRFRLTSFLATMLYWAVMACTAIAISTALKAAIRRRPGR